MIISRVTSAFTRFTQPSSSNTTAARLLSLARRRFTTSPEPRASSPIRERVSQISQNPSDSERPTSPAIHIPDKELEKIFFSLAGKNPSKDQH